jgi:hypothetical protein
MKNQQQTVQELMPAFEQKIEKNHPISSKNHPNH